MWPDLFEYTKRLDTSDVPRQSSLLHSMHIDATPAGVGAECYRQARTQGFHGVSSTEAESQPDQIPRCPGSRRPSAESSLARLSHPSKAWQRCEANLKYRSPLTRRAPYGNDPGHYHFSQEANPAQQHSNSRDANKKPHGLARCAQSFNNERI